MKKAACVVLILTMVIFLLSPLSSEAARGGFGGGGARGGHSGSDGGGPRGSDLRGGHAGSGGGDARGGHGGWSGGEARGGHRGGGGGGHWDRGGWWPWWPWAAIGGAAVLWPYYSPYYDPYYSPYYESPVVIQEQPPVDVQPAPSVAPSMAEKIFVYPRLGQSEELQAKDRYECHNWAVSQTHYDPTQPTSGLPEVQWNQLRADYRRAEDACLDGRGYTVK